MMRKVHDLLAPGGVVQVRVPTALNSVYFKMPVHIVRCARALHLGRMWEGHKPPYHLWEFTPRLLHQLFAKSGLSLLHCVASENMPQFTRHDQSGVRLWHVESGRDLARVCATYPLKAISVGISRVSSLGDHTEAVGAKTV